MAQSLANQCDLWNGGITAMGQNNPLSVVQTDVVDTLDIEVEVVLSDVLDRKSRSNHKTSSQADTNNGKNDIDSENWLPNISISESASEHDLEENYDPTEDTWPSEDVWLFRLMPRRIILHTMMEPSFHEAQKLKTDFPPHTNSI